MISELRHKLIVENLFNTNFSAVKVSGLGLHPIKNNVELIIGFVRDLNDSDEFFFEVQSKAKNPKTGQKEVVRVPVDDIIEIEHIEGTLQFCLHYETYENKEEQTVSISTFIKRKVISKVKERSDKEGTKKVEKTETFETKYVKQFIETFNNVLEVMDA